MTERGVEADSEAPPVSERGLVDAAHDAFAAAMQVAETTLALLRAELRLARRSAVNLIGLAIALVFLATAVWLALNAAIVVGIFQLSGNLFLGIALVATLNIAGALWTVAGMRRAWRDLTLPHTRALVASSSERPAQLEEKP